MAACGAPIVGWLAEHLGFDSGDPGGGGGGSGPEADLKRAKALGNAIVICTALPWALCCLLYSGGWCADRTDSSLADAAGLFAGLHLCSTQPSAILLSCSFLPARRPVLAAPPLPCRPGLHVTYPRDRRLALRSQRTRSGVAPAPPAVPAPSVASMPSADLWEATPADSPTAAAAGSRQRVSFTDTHPSRE